jgi:hypothetical protein
MKFVAPIPYLPPNVPEKTGASQDETAETIDAEVKRRDNIHDLPPYRFDDEIFNRLQSIANNWGADWGPVDTAFFASSDVADGDKALAFWRALVETKATDSDCDDLGHLCTLTIKGKRGNSEAIITCAVARSGRTWGIPFHCATMAFEKKGVWMIYAFAGPEACDCGAVAGLQCTFENVHDRDAVVEAFMNVMGKPKIELPLAKDREEKGEVVLKGEKIGINSYFYKDLYEYAKGFFRVGLQQPSVERVTTAVVISGFVNITISADRTRDVRKYREPNPDWTNSYNEQILKIVKNGVGAAMQVTPECWNSPI